jgi:hypothetical protein
MPPGLVAGEVSRYRAAHARCPVLAAALADGAARRARLSADVVPARAAIAPLIAVPLRGGAAGVARMAGPD